VSHRTEAILTLIPHRPPFLFLDEIIERDDRHIKAVKTLHPDEPYLAGHYPGRPLMPGVLICECVFQAGAALLFGRGGLDPRKVPVLTKIQSARFRRPVFPGARLVIEAELQEEIGPALIMKGSVSVEGLNVLRTEFVVAMADVGDGPTMGGPA
jgi:3-hydroxyacyl-[acyl-carrier-protein] dehydratase